MLSADQPSPGCLAFTPAWLQQSGQPAPDWLPEFYGCCLLVGPVFLERFISFFLFFLTAFRKGLRE